MSPEERDSALTVIGEHRVNYWSEAEVLDALVAQGWRSPSEVAKVRAIHQPVYAPELRLPAAATGAGLLRLRHRRRQLANLSMPDHQSRGGQVTRAPKRPRSVKVGDELWQAAQAKADERGEVLSEEIRRFLERYVRKAK